MFLLTDLFAHCLQAIYESFTLFYAQIFTSPGVLKLDLFFDEF